MKYLDEFSNPEAAGALIDQIHAAATRRWTIMEACGGQTHTIIHHGIDQLLFDSIDIAHGPGCAVCVTPLEIIDLALAIAKLPEVIFCSFGDMLDVPGSHESLLHAKSMGADVRIIYSPLDALRLARENPTRQVVLFGIGFETPAPANAMAVFRARQLGVANFSLLASHLLMAPAIAALIESPSCRAQAFLAAGHVCSVMGTGDYVALASKHAVPIVVTGFEPLDILTGILLAVRQLEAGRHELENAYPRAVCAEGNPAAIRMLNDVFELTDRNWRGIGTIAQSGWKLAPTYSDYDAEQRFGVGSGTSQESGLCRSGDVLQGLIKPVECAAFAKECTPHSPLGATMIASGGACAAYYADRHGRLVEAS